MAAKTDEQAMPHCMHHSGIQTEVDHLKKSDSKQWDEIRNIKTRGTAQLTVLVITLIGVIVNLIVILANRGGH